MDENVLQNQLSRKNYVDKITRIEQIFADVGTSPTS